MAIRDAILSKQDFVDNLTDGVDPICPNPRCDSENNWEIGPVVHGKYTYACKACGTRIGTQVNVIGDHLLVSGAPAPPDVQLEVGV